MQEERAAAQLHWEKTQRFASLEENREKHLEQKQRLHQDFRNWRNRLGIKIELEDARLYLLAQAVHQFQLAQSRVNAKTVEQQTVQNQYNESLEQVNHDLSPYVAGDERAKDADHALAQIHHLQQRQQDHREAQHRRSQAEREIQECNQQIDQLATDRECLFTELGLEINDELTLHDWCNQFPNYTQATETLRLAEHDAQNATSALGDSQELLEKKRGELEIELENSRRLAEKLPDVHNKIGEIQGRVHDAKNQTALESALAHEQNCLEQLRALRDKEAAQLVGNLLVQHLEKQQRDIHQPQVLRRASDLFARITHGRYQLLVSGKTNSNEQVGFRALDTAVDREQNLTELSSGTRLQVLLAVRVAFVEQQERGTQLPFIFDETLGNSDEQRAGNIIEAALEIARRGRQVFYFTAQYDELAKWKRILTQRNSVPFQDFDLARIRNFSEVEYAPERIEIQPPQTPTIPAPEADNWWSYGPRLRVPPLDHYGHLGGVHLWYLIDDVQALFRLLTHGINRWGQFQTLVKIGAAEGFDDDSPIVRRAEASAKLLEHLLRFWRQGRGKPVDQEIFGSLGGRFICLSQESNPTCRLP